MGDLDHHHCKATHEFEVVEFLVERLRPVPGRLLAQCFCGAASHYVDQFLALWCIHPDSPSRRDDVLGWLVRLMSSPALTKATTTYLLIRHKCELATSGQIDLVRPPAVNGMRRWLVELRYRVDDLIEVVPSSPNTAI